MKTLGFLVAMLTGCVVPVDDSVEEAMEASALDAADPERAVRQAPVRATAPKVGKQHRAHKPKARW